MGAPLAVPPGIVAGADVIVTTLFAAVSTAFATLGALETCTRIIVALLAAPLG